MKTNKEALHVLQVFGSLNRGGAECRMMDIYRYIDRESCSFDFVTMQSGDQHFEQEISALGGIIHKIEYPQNGHGIVKHFRQLRQCMRSKEYNAVHAHTSYHCGVVMLAAWLEHIPVRISHARTTGSKQKGILTKMFLSIGRALISVFSTHRFAISQDAGEYLFGNRKFEIVPNAIDVDRYQSATEKYRIEMKKKLGIPGDAFVIGQVARFNWIKNHEFTVTWFSRYVKKNKNAFLVLVGDGPLKSKIEKLVDECGLKKNVLFTGVRNDVPQFIHIFDVLFFPSVYEGLGGVALEAQAAGIPVVESDTIPPENDLGLNMVQRCTLRGSLDNWDAAVESSKRIEMPANDVIREKFRSCGYSIESAADRYIRAYQGEGGIL